MVYIENEFGTQAKFICKSSSPPLWKHNGKTLSIGEHIWIKYTYMTLLNPLENQNGIYDCYGTFNNLSFIARKYFNKGNFTAFKHE